MTPVDPRPGRGRPTGYHIRIEGHLEHRWAGDYEGLSVALGETGDTLLTVPPVDQAVLYGLLRKLRDLGVRLISINPAGPDLSGNTSEEETQ